MQSKKYAILLSAVNEIQAGRAPVARRLLAPLVDDFRPSEARADELLHHVFASALARHVAPLPADGANLYVRELHTPQISLFNRVAELLPTVVLARRLANEMLCSLMGGRDHVSLLSVGIGTGRQEVALLHLLAERGELPRRLDVLAIDPDPASVHEAEFALSRTAHDLGVALRFFPFDRRVEDLHEADWERLARAEGTVVALVAFSAHQVRSFPGRSGMGRDALFSRLRALGTGAVVVCEENAALSGGTLAERFETAWRHFGMTFSLVDSLGLAREEATRLKLYFAREVEGVLGAPEPVAREGYEGAESWVARLGAAGFAPAAATELVEGVRHDAVRAVARDGYVGLDYRDETLVAVLCGMAEVGAPFAPVALPARSQPAF